MDKSIRQAKSGLTRFETSPEFNNRNFMDAQIKAPFLLTCNDRGLAADAGVGREVRATGAARAPVLVVLHVLDIAARPHEVGAGRARGRRGRRRRAGVVQRVSRVAGRVGRAPAGLRAEELGLATGERRTFFTFR